jgi:hypothetical protein
MATSTFFENIVIDDEAADIIIAAMRRPRTPWPDIDYLEVERESREWSERFRRNYMMSLEPQKKQPTD